MIEARPCELSDHQDAEGQVGGPPGGERLSVVAVVVQPVIAFSSFQAQSDDDDVGGDDIGVNMDGGKMDEFFQEVRAIS